jgi:hypothetical protein
VEKFPLRAELDHFKLIKWEKIFYIKAEGDDPIVRLPQEIMSRHNEPLAEIDSHLPSPPFSQAYYSFIVNTCCALEIYEWDKCEYKLQLDAHGDKRMPASWCVSEYINFHESLSAENRRPQGPPP